VIRRDTFILILLLLCSVVGALGTFENGYAQASPLGFWGSLAALLSLGLAILFPLLAFASAWSPTFRMADLFACLLLLALPFALVVETLSIQPIWSEDRGWLRIIGEISTGQRWNPIIPKSDYPSSWQIYPAVAPFLLGIDASFGARCTALFYAGLASIFLYYTCRQLFGFAHALAATVLYCSLSTYQAFIARTGWHEISHVFPLVFLQWLFFLRLQRAPVGCDTLRDQVAFALSLALGFLTLYTPALSAAVFLVLLTLEWLRSRRWKAIFRVVFWCAVGCLPLFGMIAHRRGRLLSRHVSWYVRGGDGERSFFRDSLSTRLEEYQRQFYFLWEQLRPLPREALELWDRTQEIHLEWGTAVFACGGFAWVAASLARRSRRLRGVIAPAVLVPAILQLSRPTPWRESVVLAPCILLACIGFCCFLEGAKSFCARVIGQRSATAAFTVFTGMLFCVQLGDFKIREASFRRITLGKWFECYAAQALQQRDWQAGRPVLVPPEVYSYLMPRSIVQGSQPRWSEYKPPLEAARIAALAQQQPTAQIVISKERLSPEQKASLEEVAVLDPRKKFALYEIRPADHEALAP